MSNTCLRSAERLAIVGLVGGFSVPSGSGDVSRLIIDGSSSCSKILFLSLTVPLRIDFGGSDFVPFSVSFVDRRRSVAKGSEKVTCRLFSAESSWSVGLSLSIAFVSNALSASGFSCLKSFNKLQKRVILICYFHRISHITAPLRRTV